MTKVLFFFAGAVLLLAGCVSRGPEYFEELDIQERAALLHTARALALRGNAVPRHLQDVFVKLAPHERIVYKGDKLGKASFRWEIYERRRAGSNISQKDVNPYWVMVYATGDLRDPSWKLIHANPGELDTAPRQPSRRLPGSGREIRRVRYKN